MVINNSRKIFAIQEEFSAVYPGLNILFHAKPSSPGAPASPKLVLHSSKTLQECRAIHNEGTINIFPSMNILDVQDNFRDIFGLSVEIVRKGEQTTDGNSFGNKQTIAEINSEVLA